MTNDNDLRTALTKLVDEWGPYQPATAHLRALLAAHPAREESPFAPEAVASRLTKSPTQGLVPAPVSDTRREDVAREAEIEREALRQFPDDPYMDDRDQVRLGFEAGAEWAIARLRGATRG